MMSRRTSALHMYRARNFLSDDRSAYVSCERFLDFRTSRTHVIHREADTTCVQVSGLQLRCRMQVRKQLFSNKTQEMRNREYGAIQMQKIVRSNFARKRLAKRRLQRQVLARCLAVENWRSNHLPAWAWLWKDRQTIFCQELEKEVSAQMQESADWWRVSQLCPLCLVRVRSDRMSGCG